MRWLFLIFLCFTVTAANAAGVPLQVENVRYSELQDGARLVFDLNDKTDYKVSMLASPPRLVVDVKADRWKPAKSQFMTSSIFKAWQSGATDDGLIRAVFDLKKPALVKRAFTLPRTDTQKNRLVIDMTPASQNLFDARKGDVFGNAQLKGAGTTAAAPSPDSYAAQASVAKAADGKPAPARKYTVVIDAGHGGADPGAIGHGVMEKHLTLAFARAVRKQLEETGRYKVVLTRDKDTYIKLRDRLDLSRRVKADLFISLHADKIGRDNVRGASMYTLSETASDAETARLAEGENNAGFVAGVDLARESQDVADILLELAMREKMNESNMFARMLTQSFSAAGIRLLPKSHRSAGFAVLKAPDVPSVLIETGFLSNAAEAKLLSSGQFQQKLAGAVVDGIEAYFRKIQALEKR